MSTQLIINGQVIAFPTSGDSPDWAPAVVQFAQAVEAALNFAVGTYDVQPQSFIIDSYNVASNINIPSLSFPATAVRSVFIQYSVYRSTDSATAFEAGDMIAMLSPSNPLGQKWTLTQGNRTGPGAQITFNVLDNGQFQFSTTALAGSNHSGKIAFVARSLEQT